jgi:hypothetical protein
MNEQVMRHGQFKPGPPRPLGKIVVIKEPQPKPLVEPADLSINGPFHEQAKARQLGHGEPLPAMLIASPASKRMHVQDITIRHALDQLRRRRTVGHGANEADGATRCARVSRPRTRIDRRSPFPGDILFSPRLGIGQCNHLIKPAISHDNVIIQQHQVFPARKLQPLVDRRRESQVCGIRNHSNRHSRQVARAPVK